MATQLTSTSRFKLVATSTFKDAKNVIWKQVKFYATSKKSGNNNANQQPAKDSNNCKKDSEKKTHHGVDHNVSRPGYLVLEDGSMFRGESFGADKSVGAEVVFNTGMVGYPESLTDPSYRGQILTFTFPLVGNYGVPPRIADEYGLMKYFESNNIHASGMIVSDYSWNYSHWNAAQSLSSWLKDENIPALTGIDTRALTKKLRNAGTMMGKIIFDDDVPFDNPNKRNLVDEVSVKAPKVYGPKAGVENPFKVIAVDCGIKHNVIRSLIEKGCEVTLVPWNFDFIPMLTTTHDGLFISNGPGDPQMLKVTVENVQRAYLIGKPVFGICMGNHVMARAAGAETYKMKFGNRGQNQPVVDCHTNKAYITPQNHGYAVDPSSLRPPWKPSFYNANDYSNEGIYCEGFPFYSVQFHPEAKGGPYDTDFLFNRFISEMEKARKPSSSKYWTLPAKSNTSKVLLLGSGGLQIGQAGEFDYSGSQAIKALKEEGIETVLMNPNIATVQTTKGLADRVYFTPVTTEMVEKVIQKEKPDAVLLGFGGQTALNTGIDLWQKEILQKNNVNVLGTSVESIIWTEDRDIFKKKLAEIGVHVAPSIATENVQDALKAAEQIGYPVIIRVAFALGGLGSGFANDPKQLEEMLHRAFAISPQVLVEKSVKGWKEVEYEVVRDSYNNCVTVCNMENFDPMGIHTGESIVVAPSQTLSNEEYHKLRLVAIRTVQHLGIVGECNIQYALDPHSEQYYVIEVNPRLSRSSALASKATGYPLAAVAAKLSLGRELPQITNSITKSTTACFEPSLDYIVTKMPRWDFGKFRNVVPQLGSAMKSVGEVMAIGRNFEESLQKAIRMVDTSNAGFDSKSGMYPKGDNKALDEELTNPTPNRIFALAEALERGYTVDRLHEMTKIDPWFLRKLENIHETRSSLRNTGHLDSVSTSNIKKAKVQGFSDKQIAKLVHTNEETVRARRKQDRVLPIVKQIDTLAAEFPAKTNYLYMTYGGKEHDVAPNSKGTMVLGSGVYRIGSSVEFDYGAVHTARSLQEFGHKTVMVNYNPETVSTDYDESDRLYFEELSLERVLDIYEFENSTGVCVSVGGQQPQNLALPLHKAGCNILGTSPVKIDQAEDRYKFCKLLSDLGIEQPEWKELTTMDEALKFAANVSYPILVRPSYVLSGAAMKVAHNDAQLKEYLANASVVSPEHPVVITKFWEGANEIELDGVANKGIIVNHAISEHIENAGVHSGDATLVFPSNIAADIQARVHAIAAKIAMALEISGPVNFQFLERDGRIAVIECNLRSSRSFPFVSKALNVDFIKAATRVFLKHDVEVDANCDLTTRKLGHVSVKAPQFSWARLRGSDPVLGVEMGSTGEVACYGENRYEAFLKALMSAGFRIPKNTVLVSGNIKNDFESSLKRLVRMGLSIVATPETHQLLKELNIPFEPLDLSAPSESTPNSVFTRFRERKIDMTVNIPYADEKTDEMRLLRRASVDFSVPVLTNREIAVMAIMSIEKTGKNLEVKAWDEYFKDELADHDAKVAQRKSQLMSTSGKGTKTEDTVPVYMRPSLQMRQSSTKVNKKSE